MAFGSASESVGVPPHVRVAAFAGGRSVPSARFRVRQYIRDLHALGIEVQELPCDFGKYPPASQIARPFWMAAALCEQARNLAYARGYDVVLFQREVLSKLITVERWVRGPTVLDVDDAIFLFRGGYVAKRLAERATVVICGNAYLAEAFSRWNSRISVIPTAVDTERYCPVVQTEPEGREIMGWIGTASNLPQLEAIEGPLVEVLRRIPSARLRVVCDRAPRFTMLGSDRVEYIPWSEESEVACIQGMDIGVMPLQDSPWARGKCSLKMLQYMACGLPTVVSAVGMNIEVAREQQCSVAVRSDAEWIDALVDLLTNERKQLEMGRAAREVAERAFSVRVLAPRVADAIRAAL